MSFSIFFIWISNSLGWAQNDEVQKSISECLWILWAIHFCIYLPLSTPYTGPKTKEPTTTQKECDANTLLSNAWLSDVSVTSGSNSPLCCLQWSHSPLWLVAIDCNQKWCITIWICNKLKRKYGHNGAPSYKGLSFTYRNLVLES